MGYHLSMEKRIYLCIDLKSFYASVECVERGLDPFEINLVVADHSRGGGAITLAATPAIKKLGVKSRGRIYEIPASIEYIIAPPRMALYMEYSAKVYSIFLKYIASEDIYIYSIDEAFLDITPYLNLYKLKPKELANKILADIYKNTGLTATVGIGTNLFLAKVAMDVIAKHTKDNMGFLDEDIFRQKMWHHKPLTDIWMIGKGLNRRLNKLGIYDLYALSIYDEKILYKEFGINARIMIEHSKGIDNTTISDIKNYKPKANSISNSQILFEDYNYKDAFLILKEMVDINVLKLVDKHLVCSRISLLIGYSKDVRKPSHSTIKIANTTNSCKLLMNEFKELYIKIVDKNYPIRQIGISFMDLKDETYSEYDLFTDIDELDKEHRLQDTINNIHKRYGKNALLKGMNYLDKSTQRYRNTTIGGHKA